MIFSFSLGCCQRQTTEGTVLSRYEGVYLISIHVIGMNKETDTPDTGKISITSNINNCQDRHSFSSLLNWLTQISEASAVHKKMSIPKNEKFAMTDLGNEPRGPVVALLLKNGPRGLIFSPSNAHWSKKCPLTNLLIKKMFILTSPPPPLTPRTAIVDMSFSDR